MLLSGPREIELELPQVLRAEDRGQQLVDVVRGQDRVRLDVYVNRLEAGDLQQPDERRELVGGHVRAG